jgi:hypothetical protein
VRSPRLASAESGARLRRHTAPRSDRPTPRNPRPAREPRDPGGL